jgi:hypothetical protein
MTATPVWQDSDILPPQEGKHNHLALAAATASAVQDTGVTGASVALGPQFITLIGNCEWYITFSDDGVNTIVDPVVATATCMGPYAAGLQVPYRVNPNQRYFKAISTAGGVLKWYLSSGPGQ